MKGKTWKYIGDLAVAILVASGLSGAFGVISGSLMLAGFAASIASSLFAVYLRNREADAAR